MTAGSSNFTASTSSGDILAPPADRADPTPRLRFLFYFAQVAESKVSQDFFGDFPPQRGVVELAVTLPEPSSGNRTDLVRQDDGIHRIARRPRGQEDLERMR